MKLHINKNVCYFCACGCGGKVVIYRKKVRKFIIGHGTRMHENRKMHSERMIGNDLFKDKKHSEISKLKISKSQIGENNSIWNGGVTRPEDGYISVLVNNHPFADINGRVKNARLVMEKYLGRYLDKYEVVHHINKIKNDDDIENLELCNRSSHARVHDKGKYKRSIETRKKMSISQKRRERIKPSSNGWFLSEETREKMSISMKNSWEKRKNAYA